MSSEVVRLAFEFTGTQTNIPAGASQISIKSACHKASCCLLIMLAILSILLVLLSCGATAFVAPFVLKSASFSSQLQKTTSTQLFFRDGYNNATISSIDQPPYVTSSYFPRLTTVAPQHRRHQQHQQRELLKRQLARIAIEEYDEHAYDALIATGASASTTKTTYAAATKSCRSYRATTAEDVMRQMESLCPVARPAYQQHRLNSRWSFVFTGVPTIGMKLITLLSRISICNEQLVDFRDVFLQVSSSNSSPPLSKKTTQPPSMTAKAIVTFGILGLPMELVVQTHLEPDPCDCLKGTHLCETFRSLSLNGVVLPTPEHWKSTRDLEITYLDDDCMIARTGFGEPHLLLRTSNLCQSPHSATTSAIMDNVEKEDEECDVNAVVTDFVQHALDRYGGMSQLTRKLVDRAYGRAGSLEQDGNVRLKAVSSIPQIVRSIAAQIQKH